MLFSSCTHVMYSYGPVGADLHRQLLLVRQTVNTPSEVLHGRVKQHVGDVTGVQTSVLVNLVDWPVDRRENRSKKRIGDLSVSGAEEKN